MIRTYAVAFVATLLVIAVSGCYVEEDRDHHDHDRDHYDHDRALYQDQPAPNHRDIEDIQNPNRDSTWHPDDYRE